MDSTKVSVTVPVYNTSKYLRKCLDSLANQTLKDIEIIIVDDGSTDNSGIICEEYANKYKNFKVIHQKNGGLAIARQTGLDAAQGEYIIVCDSDDWVEPDMYEKLYKAAKENDADMVMCGFYCEYPDGRSIPTQKWFKCLDFEGHVKELMRSNSYTNSWIRLFRRDIFSKNNISYEPGVNLGEDALILYKILATRPNIAQIDEKLYHYRKVLGGKSYTNNVSMQQIHKLSYVRNWINKHYDTKIFAEGMFYLNIKHLFLCLKAKDADHSYIKSFIRKNINWIQYLKYRKTIKSTVVYGAKILPTKFVSYAIKHMYKYFY